MDLFAFINHVNPTKVRIGEREVAEEEGAGNDDVNEEVGDAMKADQTEQVLLDSSHHSSTNAAYDEVTSVIRSSVPPLLCKLWLSPIVDATFALTPGVGTEPAPYSIFRDFAYTSEANQYVVGPSYPVGTELSMNFFFLSQDVDWETLRQTYIPKWNVTNDYALDDPNICRGVVDHLAPPVLFSQLCSMDYEQLCVEFNVRATRQTCLSFEIRLRFEHELRGRRKFKDKCVMHAGNRLCGQITTVESAEAARGSELNGLKERNAALERQVAALESATVVKNTELASSNDQIAKLTQDLLSLHLSCDELSIKAASLESDKDKLIDQVPTLEGTCFGLRDEVMGYKMFKEQVEAVQNVHVKALSDRVAGLDAELMGMALHLDEEFYPRFLTTIAGRRWILSRGVKLVVMKCLQLPNYLAALGKAIRRAIDKCMQDGLAAGIDHEKAERGLTNVATYDPSAQAIYRSVVNDLRAVDFLLLAQLASQKMRALRISWVSYIWKVMRLRIQKLNNYNPLLSSLCFPFIVGEASTFVVLATATTIALSTTFVQASSVPPISVANYEVLGTGPSTEVPSSPKIVFAKEELDSMPKHTTASYACSIFCCYLCVAVACNPFVAVV
nr:hypothetical protein [Tanacetum cinerariifolium]